MESVKDPDSRQLAGIVHDFNNLLGVALNFSILAKEKLAGAAGPPTGEQVQLVAKYLDRVENAARAAIQLNRELGALIPSKERPQLP